jgi:hypothetical protein
MHIGLSLNLTKYNGSTFLYYKEVSKKFAFKYTSIDIFHSIGLYSRNDNSNSLNLRDSTLMVWTSYTSNIGESNQPRYSLRIAL